MKKEQIKASSPKKFQATITVDFIYKGKSYFAGKTLITEDKKFFNYLIKTKRIG